jgi:hypothetical protein
METGGSTQTYIPLATKLILIGAGISIGFAVPRMREYFRKRCLADKWKDHVDEDEIQVCLYSTEHLKTLGRVEKRTLLIEEVSKFFSNNHIILDKVVSAALHSTEENPFVTRFLSEEDRWHIMNICLNRISSMFGPFHVFYNESRRCRSCYKSAWYIYSITCSQNTHHGRFFVTPYKPVLSSVDRGVKRLRIVIVSEQEMRDISAGVIKPPVWGFFNNRHKQRWDLLEKMSELFENQLVILEQCEDDEEDLSNSCDESPLTPSSWQPVKETWSPTKPDFPTHLPRHTSNPGEKARIARRVACRMAKDHHRDTDNCIMRVHIPFPGSMIDIEEEETSSKDVVLFE